MSLRCQPQWRMMKYIATLIFYFKSILLTEATAFLICRKLHLAYVATKKDPQKVVINIPGDMLSL